MQIHELNNYSDSLDDAYLVADNGSDTGKIKTTALTNPLNERINNIIAGPAPSAAEVVDARLGEDGVIYPSLGDAVREQVGGVKKEINQINDDYYVFEVGEDVTIPNPRAQASGGYLTPSGIGGNSSNWCLFAFNVSELVEKELTVSTRIFSISSSQAAKCLIGFYNVPYNELPPALGITSDIVVGVGKTYQPVQAAQPIEEKVIVPNGALSMYVAFDMNYLNNFNDWLKVTYNTGSINPLVDKNVYTNNLSRVKSLMGSDSSHIEGNISVGSDMSIPEFPRYIRRNLNYSFYGKFSTFNGIDLMFENSKVSITTTDIEFYVGDSKKYTKPHNLIFADYISILINVGVGNDGVLEVVINTNDANNNNTYSCAFSWAFTYYGEFVVKPYMSMSECKLNALCEDIKNSLWVVGDSYSGANENFVMGQLLPLTKSRFCWNALPGRTPLQGIEDLKRMLKISTPKYIVWLLGMNGDLNNYTSAFEELKLICDDFNIKIYAEIVPTTVRVDNELKKTYIENTNVSLIDFYNAVGSNADGSWYNGYQHSDGVHPTEKGAKALAMRLLVDVLELTQY